MARPELEGEWIEGWPDRKKARIMPSKDDKGRTIYARAPLLELEGLTTPTDAFYIIAQLNMCDPIHPDDYEFTISGLVDRPITLTLDEVRKLPSRTIRTVMECAGDDGEFFRWQKDGGPKPSRLKVQDEEGGWNQMSGDGVEADINEIFDAIPTTCLVSGGEWTGVRLADVLELAGVKPEATHMHIIGYDEGRPDPTPIYLSVGSTDVEIEDPGVINYDKSLELSKALDPDTILAWAQNGEYLRHVHGAPLRLIVPGWSGNWSVKWVKEIVLKDEDTPCYHQTQYFVLGDGPDDPNLRPCKELGVKSIITYPIDEDSPLKSGTHRIAGLAWSGKGAITRVEVSVDGGETWTDAYVEPSNDRWLWRRWSYLWDAKPGKYSIKARATDEENRTQPQQPWNFQMKHFDGIVPVDVEVK
jgi:DMSO/TMAO reductase YedYZ molybdopterin-dependent catalytic subunit